MFCRSLFVLLSFYLLAIVLSVHLRFTDSDYLFGILKPFLTILKNIYFSRIQISHYQIFACRIIQWINWFHIMTITSKSPEIIRSPSTICCLAPGERDFIHTIVFHGEKKLHFDKVLRSHHDFINRSDYLCHNWPGIYAVCQNHNRAVFS